MSKTIKHRTGFLFKNLEGIDEKNRKLLLSTRNKTAFWGIFIVVSVITALQLPFDLNMFVGVGAVLAFAPFCAYLALLLMYRMNIKDHLDDRRRMNMDHERRMRRIQESHERRMQSIKAGR